MLLALLFGLAIFLADRIIKIFILNNFALGETRDFIPGVLQLTYAQNTGMAFGFLAGHSWIPIVLTPLILGGLGVIVVKNMFPCKVQRLALVAIMAGGLANWVDRLAYGFVVDMFEPVFMRFAIFNLADAFITVGGIVFVAVYAMAEIRRAREKRKGQAETERDSE
ncbi:MAG: signal peptidase II [Oscillospiraceae bacterium]|nr:signal peptidase II [Oscillospiraceae bacterium]